jgi:hypothetical protein
MTVLLGYLGTLALALLINYTLCSVNPRDDDPS